MWQIIHSYTASMPEKLSRVNKIKFRQTLADLVEHLPCDDCKSHARAYMKDNKPTYSTNRDAFNYYCDFHNHINESQGKPAQNCGDLWSKRAEPCVNCSTSVNQIINPENQERNSHNNIDNDNGKNEPIPQSAAPPIIEPDTDNRHDHNQSTDTHSNQKQALTVDQFLNQSLKTSLEDYKNVSTRMFETICRNAGAPMPELVFAEKTECSNPELSCTHFPIDKQSGKLTADAPTRVYLNINQYSPRSVIHEALHYISKFKGLDVLSPTHEEEITRGARDIMGRDFPTDRITPYHATKQELRDEGSTPASVNPYKHFKERSRARLEGFTDNLPYYSRYYHGAKRHKKEQPSQQVVPTASYATGQPSYPQVPIQAAPEPPPETPSASEGFISMLDPVFAPFGDMLGMKARDVNIAHTPALIANGGIALVESNVNKFGSMVISIASSLATLAAGTLSKDSIGLTDKKLLVGLGGALFWNGALRYITNPKITEEIVHHATTFGNSIASGDVEAMVGSLTTEQPKEVEKNPVGRGRIGGHPEGDGLRRPLSSPVGGQGRPVSRRRSEEYNLDDATGDIYTDPDSTIANQGSFGKPSWFPSM